MSGNGNLPPDQWPPGYTPNAAEWDAAFSGLVRNVGTATTAGELAEFADSTGLNLVGVPNTLLTAVQSVSTIAALRALTTVTGAESIAYVEGYAANGDGGEGVFTVNSSDTTSADNGGTIIVDGSARRWYRSLHACSVSAHHFGATVNAGVDCSASVNAAINFVALTGGLVTLEAGTYTVSSTIIMKTKVGLQGKGHQKTFIVGAAGTTMDLVQTYQFPALTGTNTVGGPYGWSIKGISFNGLKASRSAGRCVAIYGYDYVIDDCEFFNAHGDGVYSEWATSGSVPVASGGNGMEALMENVKFFQNGGNGLTFNGPHDSGIINALSFLNTGYGIAANQTANYSGGCNLITVHAYANGNHGIYVNTGVNMGQVQSESNLGAAGGFYIDTAGFVVGSDITAYSNGGFGMQVNGGLSSMSNLFFHANGTNGLVVNGGANTFSNVLSSNNGQDGVILTSTGTSNIISGLLCQSNGSFGVACSGSDNAITGILAEFNTGGGVTIANGVGFVRMSGEVNNNGAGAVQVPLGTMGAGCMIDLAVFTVAGQTAWTGNIGNNFVRIAVAGAGAGSPIDSGPGVTDGSSANGGQIGEVATVQGFGVALTSGTSATITSMGLTPGDWDVTGVGLVTPSGGVTISNFASSTSTASSVLGAFPYAAIMSASTTGQMSAALPTRRVSVSAFTTIYLVTQASFSGGTVNGAGYLYARRVR